MDKKEKNNKIDFKRFKKVIDSIYSYFSAAKQDEIESFDSSSMDKKLAEMLASKDPELAAKIADSSIEQKSEAKSSWFRSPFGIAFTAGSLGFMSIVAVSVVITLILWNPSGPPQIADLKDDVPIPTITLKPQKYTNSGYVASDNKLTIDIEDKIKSDIKSSIKVSPQISFEVKVTETDNGSQIELVPDEQLSADTEYTVSIVTGTEFESGAKLRKDLNWVLLVEPKFAVLETTPRTDAENVPVDTTIEIEFNHKNINAAELAKHFSISPAVKGKFEQFGLRVIFAPDAPLAPVEKYTVTVKGSYANQDGEKLGEDTTFNFSTSFEDSAGKRYSQRNLNWDDGYTGMQLQNTTEGVYALVEPSGGLSEIGGSMTFDLFKVPNNSALKHIIANTDVISDMPAGAVKIHTHVAPVDSSAEYKRVPPEAGFYILRVTHPRSTNTLYKYFVKSDLVVMHAEESSAFQGWVYSGSQETPQSGISAELYSEGSKVATVNTDTKGKYAFSRKGDTIIYTKGSEVAVFTRYSISQYDTGYYEGVRSADSVSLIQLDRKLYRPGNIVHFKGYIADSVNGSSVRSGQTPYVQLTAGQAYWGYEQNQQIRLPLVDQKVVVNREFGTFSGSFKIPVNYTSGLQSIEIRDNEGTYLGRETFGVENVVKPESKFDVTFNRSTAVVGESITATIQGYDYSGQPMVNEEVVIDQYQAVVSRYNLDYPPRASALYGDVVATRKVKLDQNGRYIYTFTPNFSTDETNYANIAIQVYPSTNDSSISSSSNVLLSQAKHDFIFKPTKESLFNEDKTELNITSVDAFNRTKPVANKSTVVTIRRVHYERIQVGSRIDPDTKEVVPIYDSNRIEEDVLTRQITTDSQGKAKIQLDNLENGSYYADLRQGDVTYKDYLFSRYGDNFGYQAEIEIAIENSTVKVGDTVKGAISSSDFKNGVLVIGGSKVELSTEIRIAADREKQDFSFVVKDSMYPYVNVCAILIANYDEVDDIGGTRGLSDCRRISIESDKGLIDVSVNGAKEVYKPGEDAEIEISTTRGGKPVQAEVALAVVDQAILDLADNPFDSIDGRDIIYSTLIHEITFASPQLNVRFLGGQGSGGGGQDSVRSDFPDTATWEANIKTDASGKAKYKFTLPDSLTQWNMKVVGVTKDMELGDSELKFRTQLDRNLSANIPSFVRVGDKVRIDSTIANFGEGIDAELQYECTGCTNKTEKRNANVGQNRKVVETFELTPAPGVKSVSVKFTLTEAGKTIDSILHEIPVYSGGRPESDIKFYLVDSDSSKEAFAFELPEDMDPALTNVDVTVSRGFALDQFIFVADPTLNSTQDLSVSIMQHKLVLDNFDDFKGSEQYTQEQLKSKIDDYYGRLVQNQATNGGFGWFDYDAVDLEASVRAAEAISTISDSSSDFSDGRLSDYFAAQINSSKRSIEDKFLALLGLSYIDPKLASIYAAEMRVEYDKDKELQKRPLLTSNLMQTYINIGSTGDAAGLSQNLLDSAQKKDDYYSWKDEDSKLKIAKSELYTTAHIYRSVVELEEWDIKYRTRNWLLAQNNINFYLDSNDSYVAYVLGLSDVENLFPSEENLKVGLSLNGKRLSDVNLTKETVFGRRVLAIDGEDLKSGENKLELTRIGKSPVFITVKSTFIDDGVVENSKKFKVEKRYIDLLTDQVVSNTKLKKNRVYVTQLKVTANEDIDGMVVSDYFAAGITPVNLDYRAYSGQLYDKLYDRALKNKSFVWGSEINTDRTSFHLYELKKGKTQNFEYLIIPTIEGEYSLDGVYMYDQDLPDEIYYSGFSDKTVVVK